MKTLEEFIDDKVEHFGDDMGSDAIYTQRVINETAAEILRVAEKYGEKDCPLKCDAHSEKEKEIFNTGYEEGVWGLIDFLKSYINSTNTEGGE